MFLIRFLKFLAICFAALSFLLVVSGIVLISHFSEDLPDTESLRNVQYQIPLSIYSRTGKLIARFGEKKRNPISIQDVPKPLIDAFLAAEDDRFFDHPGVDYKGLLRASIQLLLTGQKKQGGSTITMQVVRNFLLTREKTYQRKIKEIILAMQLERKLSKDEILELYLNKIYLGHRAYGIAAAAEVYYGRPLNELTLAEYAMISGLPKAPSKFNPVTNPERALIRRQYVLQRMLDLDFITNEEFEVASSQPVTAKVNPQPSELEAPYIAEMVRKEMFAQFGDDIYNSGLKVYTTIDKRLQTAANQALHKALHEYDQRHGYRRQTGANAESPANLTYSKIIGNTLPALVENVEKEQLTALLQDGTEIVIPWANIKWARPYKSRNYVGARLKSANDIAAKGEIIRVRKLENGKWMLAQVPEAEGAIVALNPADGAILALSGGFDFHYSKYNRATQAKRQPGSGFKPVIYTTALETGFTAASIIIDAPIVVDDPSQESEWRPQNYSRKFYGPTRIRTALRKSRNLISIRLLRELGINRVIETALRFGFQKEQLPQSLSLALGSGYATPLQMARFYAVFANGGFLVNPYFIDRIESHNGELLFQAKPARACPLCDEYSLSDPENAPRVVSPQINFLMNSLLRDVVQRGTATRAKELGRTDLAGKTGTTNDQRDAWFNGFTPEIVTTTWVGFDDSGPLGSKETGGRAALPMWIAFMNEALKVLPDEQPLTPPEGIVKAYINPSTGMLADHDSSRGIWEYFREEKAPTTFYGYLPGEDSAPEEKSVETLF